jgi:hypothetical protein
MIAAMAAPVSTASTLRLLSGLAVVSGETAGAAGGAASTLRLLSGLGDMSGAAGGVVTVGGAGTNTTGLAGTGGAPIRAAG